MKSRLVILLFACLFFQLNAENSGELKSLVKLPGKAESRLNSPSVSAVTLFSSESMTASGSRVIRKVVNQGNSKRPILVEETYSGASSSAVLLNRVEMVADQMLVKIKKNSSKNEFRKFCQCKSFSIQEEIYGSEGLFLVDIPLVSADSLRLSIAEAMQNEDVEYAEPDYILRAFLTPNDPKYTDNTLWGMKKIDCPNAWDVTTGSHDIVVGVIDTGVDYNHEDLKDNMWTNPGEIPGNGIDDDGNGFIDDIYGYDFANSDANPMDDQGHGTHCAGTIGGVGNNAKGIVGVCWKVKIMALKFLASDGSGNTSNAVKCVNYATKMNAHLTSNSWGGGGFNQSLKDAINANGKFFAAAAGNESNNNDTTPNYPSNYDCPNIIAVAATDSNDNLASFSNYGATTVDLAAPGVNIYSAKPGGSYQNMSGTSMATPHVAGAAALLLSADPSLTHQDIKKFLMDGVDKIPGLSGKCVTGGRLNMFNSIEKLKYIKVTSPDGGEVWKKGDTKTVSWSSKGYDGNVKIELLKNNELELEIVADTENDGSFDWTIPDTLPNSNDYKIKISALSDEIFDTSDAEFAISSTIYLFTFSVSPEGSGTTIPSGQIQVIPDFEYQISAIPNEKFFFVEWQATGGAQIADIKKETTTAIASGDATINACFEEYLYVLEEHFESETFPPEGWTKIDGNSAPGGDFPSHWQLYTGSAVHDGNGSALCGWGYNLDEWLISPSFSLDGIKEPVLNFWWLSGYEYMVNPYNNGDLFVRVSADGGNTWSSPIWDFDSIGPWSSYTWYEATIDMSPYIGKKDLKIAFQVIEDDGDVVLLDDIVIRGKNAPPIPNIISPNGGETFFSDSENQIQWEMSGNSKVKIELLKAEEVYSVIAEESENTGKYDWFTPENQPAGDDYKIRITNLENTEYFDESDANFSIAPPFITVLSPNGGEKLQKNFTYKITWTSGGVTSDSKVKISLLSNGSISTIINNEAINSGIFDWTVANTIQTGDKYKVLIESLDNPQIKDESDAFFSIENAPLYKLTMLVEPIDSGTTTPPSGSVTDAEGAMPYNISATPASGFYFNGWKAQGDAKFANPNILETTVTLYSDSTVTASFTDTPPEKVALTISVSPPASGITNPVPGVHTVFKNLAQEIKAVPADGYTFQKWTLAGSGTIEDENSASTSVTLLGNAKVEATFAAVSKDLTLTMGLTGGGSVSPSVGKHTVKSGTPIEIKATASGKSFFSGWTSEPGAFVSNSSSNTTTVTLTSDATVTANFSQTEPTSKQVTIITKGFGTTEPSENISLFVGIPQSIKAIPNPGYLFKNWTVTNGTVAEPNSELTTLTITDDAILTANFEPGSSKLTMAVQPGNAGNTTPSGTVDVTNNAPQAISATENPGYVFINWSATGSVAINNITEKNTSAILTGDSTIIANFAVKSYKISFSSAGNGSIQGNKNQIVQHGQNCSQVTAVPDDKYVFDKWTGDYEGTENPLTIKNVASDMNIVANFAHVKANLTMSVEGNGTTTPSVGINPIDTETPFDISATPAIGWHFVSWTASENATIENPNAATTKITITGDATATAKFEINKYTLKYSAGANGSLSGETNQTVEHGANGTPVTAIPDEGYYFTSWSDKLTDNPRTDKNVTGNIDVTASFINAAATAKLTMSVSPASSGTTSPAVGIQKDYPPLTEIQISALPSKGYYFKEWTAEPAENVIFLKTATSQKSISLKQASSQTIKLLGDATVTANFEQMPLNATLTMAANPQNGGETSPEIGQTIKQTGTFISIEAKPSENFHFVNWTATEGAKITSPLSSKTTVVIYFDSTVTANFAEGGQASALLTVQASPQEGGTTSPDGAMQAVAGTPYDVSAEAAEGFIFVNWSADNASATIQDPFNPETEITILSDTVLTANFVEMPNLTDMALGRIYKYTISNGQKFDKNPKVFAKYTDPISQKPDKKASLKVVQKIVSPTDKVNLEWKARIPLVNKKKWDKTQTCEENLMDPDVLVADSCPTQLHINGADTGVELHMMPPEITGVFDSKGNELFSVSLVDPPDGKIVIKGFFFGTVPPAVFMEYEKDGQIKYLKLKTDKVLAYKNSKGKPSCMDIESGLSEITAYLPKDWPTDWNHSEEHNIVIDNKVGRSYWLFQTEK